VDGVNPLFYDVSKWLYSGIGNSEELKEKFGYMMVHKRWNEDGHVFMEALKILQRFGFDYKQTEQPFVGFGDVSDFQTPIQICLATSRADPKDWLWERLRLFVEADKLLQEAKRVHAAHKASANAHHKHRRASRKHRRSRRHH